MWLTTWHVHALENSKTLIHSNCLKDWEAEYIKPTMPSGTEVFLLALHLPAMADLSQGSHQVDLPSQERGNCGTSSKRLHL